jgi:hypothetical protein
MEPVNWKALLQELEAEAADLRKESTRARDLRRRAEQSLQLAESASAEAEIINRLDFLLMGLTEAAKENVCTNTKCPHYSKRCKMR